MFDVLSIANAVFLRVKENKGNKVLDRTNGRAYYIYIYIIERQRRLQFKYNRRT